MKKERGEVRCGGFRPARAAVLALVVSVLAGCSGGHHEGSRVYESGDVKQAFARHGIALQAQLVEPRGNVLQVALAPDTGTEQIDVNVFRSVLAAKRFVEATTHQRPRFRVDVAGSTVFYRENVEVVYDRSEGLGRLDDVKAALRDLD
jgi:hypothetical protein